MEKMVVTTVQLQNASVMIRKQNSLLMDRLNQMIKVMNSLNGIWDSPAQRSLVMRFKKMLPIFDNYQRIIESYAKFLDSTYEGYQSLEKQIESGIHA